MLFFSVKPGGGETFAAQNIITYPEKLTGNTVTTDRL